MTLAVTHCPVCEGRVKLQGKGIKTARQSMASQQSNDEEYA
jgi:hypothetical protein